MWGYNPEVSDLKEKVQCLKDELRSQKKSYEEEFERLNRKTSFLVEDHKIEMERKNATIDLKIQSATKDLNTKITQLTIEKSKAEEEAKILTKAFENLGFDVKDMKDILNKLVDGVVAKNTVQLIK